MILVQPNTTENHIKCEIVIETDISKTYIISLLPI